MIMERTKGILVRLWQRIVAPLYSYVSILVWVCETIVNVVQNNVAMRDRMATKYSHFSDVFCLSPFLPFPFFSRFTLIQNLNRNLFCTVILTFRIIFFVHFFLCWKILFFAFLWNAIRQFYERRCEKIFFFWDIFLFVCSVCVLFGCVWERIFWLDQNLILCIPWVIDDIQILSM
jgi:hypothetical protein